jgi:hypothetical protein
VNFSKEMIDLIREIRKRVPSDTKPSIKLANPELFDEIRDCYAASSDNILKALTRELFSMAGPEVSLSGNNANTPESLVSKIYRGQHSLVPAKSKEEASASNKPKRIYRGRVVA